MRATEDVRDLTQEEYELFRSLIYEQSGINLGEQKMQLVRARLGKRLRTGGFRSYRAYYEHVRKDKTGRELCHLIDAISTNTTHLFREKQHFDFLAETVRRWLKDPKWRSAHRELRIWSAACSSGEEPHSIAMVAHDALRAAPEVDLKILATDISTRMLERARAGLYEVHRLGTVPEAFRRRYFVRYVCGQDARAPRVQQAVAAGAPSDGRADRVYAQVNPALQRCIKFTRFNLMAPHFPFRRPFDVVFCRNVMIYFDRPTQQTLVNKLARHIRPGGYLLIGHSESLSAVQHPLVYVRPTVYQRPAP